MAHAKLSFLGELPYALAACRSEPTAENSMLKRCLQKYDEVPDHKHHRVSREFFSKDGALRQHLDEMADSGLVHADLDLELRSLENIPISEERAEGVHRDVTMEITRAPASKLPHLAATLRMEENFRFYTAHCAEGVGADLFSHFWRSFKLIAQRTPFPSRTRPALMCRRAAACLDVTRAKVFCSIRETRFRCAAVLDFGCVCAPSACFGDGC